MLNEKPDLTISLNLPTVIMLTNAAKRLLAQQISIQFITSKYEHILVTFIFIVIRLLVGTIHGECLHIINTDKECTCLHHLFDDYIIFTKYFIFIQHFW